MDKNKIHVETSADSLLLDLFDNKQISNVSLWCKENLKDEEWDMSVMRIFNNPWFRFQFRCSKKKFLALLNI